MRVILLGPPGCGKGTQGDRIEQSYGFPRISTGDLLRAEVAAETLLGLKARAVMESGELVSDVIVVEMIKERILSPDCRRGYILDGFPRTIAQAESLSYMDGSRPEVAIDICVYNDVLIERLSVRRVCSCGAVYNLKVKPPAEEGKCDVCGGSLLQRKDDDAGVIRERLRVYREQTEPLIVFYKKKGNYFSVDGEQDIESVFNSINDILKRMLQETGELRE
jgi:adenylate kinase